MKPNSRTVLKFLACPLYIRIVYMTHKQYVLAIFVRSRGPYFDGAITKTTLTPVTNLEGKHTTVVIGRHVAIRIYEPKVVTHFLSPRTSGANFDTSCGFIRTCICTWYMIIGMDYHIEKSTHVL